MGKSTALVTGAAGFIGSHVVRGLLEQGWVTPVGMDDLSGGFRRNLPDGVAFVEGSITDVGLVERLFDTYRFDYVYHLAAYAAEGLSHYIRRFNYTNNLIGSVNLINQAVRHEVKCFVFTSSIAVYGPLPPPLREEDHPVPEDPYGVAKYAVEMDLEAARRMFGLPFVVFRPHNVYGERQNLADPYRNVLGIFMRQILQGRPMTVFGDGAQRRAFTYVGDIASMIAASPRVPAAINQVINIGSDAPCRVHDLALMIAAALRVPGHPIDFLPARPEVQDAYCAHERQRRIFGDVAETPLREGVARMAAWARTVTLAPREPFTAIEVDRNMPPSWRALVDAARRGPKGRPGAA